MGYADTPFDFIKFLFSSKDIRTWNDATTYEKTKWQFLLNRTMSIGFPIPAMQLNMIKTDGLGVAETWHLIAKRFYGNRVPQFIYTKVAKKDKEKNPLASIPKECIDFWCDKYECGEREFLSMFGINPEPLIEELKYIKENFHEKNKKDEMDK